MPNRVTTGELQRQAQQTKERGGVLLVNEPLSYDLLNLAELGLAAKKFFEESGILLETAFPRVGTRTSIERSVIRDYETLMAKSKLL